MKPIGVAQVCAGLALAVACSESKDSSGGSAGASATGGGGAVSADAAAGEGGGAGVAGSAPIDAADALPTYPLDPSPLDAAACLADHDAYWSFSVPAQCSGKRTCIDARQRFWVDGAPFIPRGVYHGGVEFPNVLTSCPAGAPCEATDPADADAYVKTLADGGINLILEKYPGLRADLLAAIQGEARMKIAAILWPTDVFTQATHDALVAEITTAVADPNVAMWFGPDEIGLNALQPLATGIRRILRGKSSEIDALLAGKYSPGGTPYLPDPEPPHDPEELPFTAALVQDPALAVGSELYDVLMPVTYPFQEPYSSANAGIWGTWRTGVLLDQNVPVMPVLQMVGIEGLQLSQPTPGQASAQIFSTMAHGAHGAFYFKVAGDDPAEAGRNGYFAPDLVDSWAAFSAAHALQDAMIPVLFGDATETSGTESILEWRTWTLGDRRVVMIVNPTPYHRVVDLDAIVSLGSGELVRHYADCRPFTERALEVPGYAHYVLEVY